MYNLTLKIAAGDKKTFRATDKAEAMVLARAWMRQELGRAPAASDIASIRGYDEDRAGFLSAIAPAMSKPVEAGIRDWAKSAAA